MKQKLTIPMSGLAALSNIPIRTTFTPLTLHMFQIGNQSFVRRSGSQRRSRKWLLMSVGRRRARQGPRPRKEWRKVKYIHLEVCARRKGFLRWYVMSGRGIQCVGMDCARWKRYLSSLDYRSFRWNSYRWHCRPAWGRLDGDWNLDRSCNSGTRKTLAFRSSNGRFG